MLLLFNSTWTIGHLVDVMVSNITFHNYLRQVNEVNDGDNAFVRCVSVCLSV